MAAKGRDAIDRPLDDSDAAGAAPADTRRRLARLAWWLDSSIPLPGSSFRIGFDPLIGLVPGIGDLIGLGVSSYILTEAARLGAPRSVLIRMAGNVALETVVGVVPLFGDVFDAAWKANQRNVRLLEGYLARPARVRRSSRLVLAGVLALLLFFVLVLGMLVFVFLRWLFTTVF